MVETEGIRVCRSYLGRSTSSVGDYQEQRLGSRSRDGGDTSASTTVDLVQGWKGHRAG
jgi:hypothetical protein